MNEDKIITLVKNGETNAYRTLVERYQAGLIIHSDMLVHDRATAEDIAQEALVKAFYSIRKFDASKGAFSTWLYRIATNLAKDYLRKHRLRQSLIELDTVASEPPMLSEAEIKEIQHIVKNLTPPEYAHVITAYFWEGKRYEEIAVELGVPIGTIGTWLTRAKRQLRKELS